MKAISSDPRDDQPLRDGSSLMAYLHILKKAHRAMVGHDAAHRRFIAISTRGHARKYIEELMPMLLQERARHRSKREARPKKQRSGASITPK